MNLDWKNIRPLNGSRDSGFEELCSQLARVERPPPSEFHRKGSPDAGVECYAVLSDGTEWAWQAKYFHALGSSQWSQIDKSVKKALDKHPRLARYFVCTPVDRPDARIDGQKSAMEKWEERVEKWTTWATERGMEVDFIYWGSHELIERLARPEHTGLTYFWFNVQRFDDQWFQKRLEEALRAAGPRYTPQLHIDLPISWIFEVFGRTDRFFDREKSAARRVRSKLRALEYQANSFEAPLKLLFAKLSSRVQTVLTALGALEAQPTGSLPFEAIAEQIHQAEDAAGELSRLLEEYDQGRKTEVEDPETAALRSHQRNEFREHQSLLSRLTSELYETLTSLKKADSVATNSLMLVNGSAGTGKTHLLCDVARQRIDAGRPTVLLMGQRFVGSGAPWSQALDQLDLPALSAEHFVGALEAAAQAAGSRALFMIDGINEGNGRNIWPTHLAAFLAHLERSPWIGVVLAVRSSYEDIVIPPEVYDRAAMVTHQGFSEHEYDATKTFFSHYELELPSTPLLAPEFRNPLFLKTLCQGLREKGEHRLPRGFQGISSVFNLYLSALNKRLASSLGFNPQVPIVRQALEAVVEATLDEGQDWLTLTRATEVVDALLPGREFERSLYRSLVAEGVLVEMASLDAGGDGAESVVIAYERFGHHLQAKFLLDRHQNGCDFSSAFVQGGPLAFISDKSKYVSPGLLEALCIQIPERTGHELISIAPTCAERWQLGTAFRQSLIWREYGAFSDRTQEALDHLDRTEGNPDETIELLLTVASLPEHPFNAEFLDRRLRKDTMPERDSWWSVYLHRAWNSRGAVDRLVDWATTVEPESEIDDEAIDLTAIALTWMLTTSNRFLRDRATKALVSLLTARLPATTRLVERFATVDDPYVTERVYAVAYGIAMRSNDPTAVGKLATCVYDSVFATTSPPPNILLRDYARGVVERALHLGSPLEILPDRIRPPYRSTWPTIPTEEDIAPLVPDWSKAPNDNGTTAWGRHRIVRSVMDDDFARYVIGSGSNWLSLRLEDPPWQPPHRSKDRSDSLFPEEPPRFDRRSIQRYIIKRVFDLGWTDERFESFDKIDIGYHGRRAAKAERIGKKYQWIAYYEILAFISDHFQYLERFQEGLSGQAYEGTWQLRLRNIDPSNTRTSLRGGTSWDGHVSAWWAMAHYDSWGDPGAPRQWILNCDDLPRIEDLLRVTNPEDGSRWLTGHGFYNWKKAAEADQEPSDVEQREIWYYITGYLLRENEAPTFLRWAKSVDFWGRWMPEPAELYRMFLGEHAWAPASRYFQNESYSDEGWTKPSQGCPVKIRSVAFEYFAEAGGFDCSIDDSYTLRLPISDLMTDLSLQWTGRGGDFVNAENQLVAQDPTANSDGPDALLLREGPLRQYLSREKLTIGWAVLGEKRVLLPESDSVPRHPSLRITGAYILSEGNLEGVLKPSLQKPHGEEQESGPIESAPSEGLPE